MKIFGLCLVKNEADIVEETLPKALKWCDKIFVFDTGSTDQTWEIVQKLNKTYPHLVPFKKQARAFRDELRSEIYNRFRCFSDDGDWWCRLDADEIYIDNPVNFLGSLKKSDQVVYSLSHQYYFTEKELAAYQQNSAGFLHAEVEKRLRHYICNHSEIRFFRQRHRLTWQGGSWPRHLGLVAEKRIRLKHFQYRSPEQIQKRLETRMVAIRQGYKNFAAYDHEADWRAKVVASKTLHFDKQDGCYELDLGTIPSFVEVPLIRLLKKGMQALKLWP